MGFVDKFMSSSFRFGNSNEAIKGARSIFIGLSMLKLRISIILVWIMEIGKK